MSEGGASLWDCGLRKLEQEPPGEADMLHRRLLHGQMAYRTGRKRQPRGVGVHVSNIRFWG